ncbi:hypothetical protein Tco_0253684, partial [Tanacetum coccineum]
DAELPLTDSETKSDEEVPVINTGDQDEGQDGPNPGEQDEGQARPNLGIQDEGQARSNPGDAAESQPKPSLTKTVALVSQSMAWTTSDTRYESAGVSGAQELSPTDSLMHEDSIPNEQVHLSDDEDSGNDHLPKADSRKDWWKPLPEEERTVTPKLAWIISSSNVSDVENNWASTLVSTYETPAENSLLEKTGDMMTFTKWYCRQVNKTTLTQADFKGQA